MTVLKTTILISSDWGDKPTKENFDKHGIVPMRCVDAGMYRRNYHTYTYQGKLYCGTGYAWSCKFNPTKDNIVLEDITGLTQENLKAVYPRYVYPKEDVS